MPKGIPRRVQDRIITQQAVRELFGEQALKMAHRQFCVSCKNRLSIAAYDERCFYHLLPLTLSGVSCPYFTPTR